MAEKTNSQINEENLTTIDALGTYLDYAAPVEQFGSNFLGRIAKIQPIQTQEDLVERGLIGADGLLTPQGELFKTLNDNKFINTDGTLSEKSTAFLMDEDDALRPENLNAWRIRKQNKIGETPSSWGDTFGSLGELLYDAGVGLGTMVKLGVQNALRQDPDTVIYNLKSSGITLDEEKVRETLQRQSNQLLNKSSVAATSFVENSIKAFSETGAMIDLGGAWALSLPSKLLGDAKNATEIVDTARQFQDRVIKSNQDAAIGSTLDAVFQTTTYVDEMARAKAEMPKAEFDQTIKQTAAAGQIFVDPMEMAKIGTVLRLATKPIVSRLTLNAERVIGKAASKAERLAQIDVDIADVERAKGMAQNAAELAKRTGEAARQRFDLNGDQNLLRRANTAEDIFNRSSAQVARFTDDGIRLSDEAAQLTADSQRLASRIPVAAAQSYEAAAKAGRGLKALPFKTFAGIVEPVGRGIVALDDGLDSVSKKLGINAAYNILTSKVGQAVGYGAAVGLGPVPAAIGAAGSVLKSGPFLQRLADTSRIMGTEMAKAQSQIPFFQRVANNPMISPAHRSLAHLADAATLGGFLPNISRRAVKGAALSFPLDFAAQYMSDGGEINQNTFKQAVAESVLIGGSSASLGGMFAGTKQRHKELSVNDEINFRNEITAPDQKALFTLAPSGIRRAIGTFSAVFPSVNIELTESGGGFHDDNTIGIDLNSSNPLKYLLAHEVKHLLVHRNQMHMPIVAMMLGDGETGGLMRSPDGTLNPEFEAFSKEYNSRQIASGRQPVSLGKLAEEFFVEAGVDDMVRITESGELGAIASRTEARRMIGRLFNGIFDKSTVLKDFHLRIGGLMDQGGKLVQGNGLLDSKLTQTQEMRNMTRNMLSRAAGRSVGSFQPLGASNVGDKGAGPGINLPITPGDKAMIEKIGPVEFEMETVNGQRQVARDSNGDPIPLDFNTQLMRSRTGALIQEAIGNRPSTYQSSPGEMRLNDEGIWEGYLPPDLLEYIKRKGSLAPEQIRMVEHVNSMIKNFKGDVAVVINHPATGRNKKGKLNYKTLKATLRQVTPISWTITKDGNLMLGLMSVTQLKSNIDSRISSKLGQKLYQGNRAKLMIDIGKVMELHQKGKRTDAYFDKEYGAAKSQQFKNFVNSVFGLITKKQGEANPIFSQENLSGNGVYKTYRADRVSQATKITGDKYPFQYDFVVQNMMPNGLPTLDDQGRPVAQNRLPEPIDKKLQIEITQLQDQIDRMYESGRTKGVEDLEAKLETLLDKSETDMAAMQMESMQEFDSANPSPEEALVNSWYRWTGKSLPDESADLKRDYGTFGAFVRASQGDMIGKVKDIGTLNENISDKQIEDAAKESAAAYERRRDALKSSARDRNVTKAVNINDSSQDFTGQIIRGEKTIETRDALNNALQPLLGQRVGLVSTGVGDTKIVGYATVGDQPIIYNNEAEFRKDQGKHLVPQGSKYDIKQGQKKYGYELKDVVAVKPFAPKSTNRKYSVIDPSTLNRLPEPASTKQYMPEVNVKSQMDNMLANPPKVPKDLQEAWDIGHRTQGLSDAEAVYSGRVPDWVFNNGNDVNQFYEAGRKGENPEYIVGWRKGKIPESGRSKNYADSSMESGVSLAYAHNRTDMETSPMTMIGVSDRKKTYVSGWAFPKSQWGSDGEIVVLAAKEFNSASSKQYMPEVASKESGKPIDLMAYTSVGGNPDMIMSAKWGRTESGINPETGKKQAAQTSALVANSSNPEDHQVGFQRIDSLLKTSDLIPAQKQKLEEFVIKTAGFAVDSPGFRDLPVPKTLTEAKNIIAKVKDRMAKNLLSIYDAVPPPVRNYWQRWYPLAFEWNNAQSKVHSIPAPAIAGMNARLSPGKDWIHNVNMTERILSGYTNGISMTPEIAAGAGPLIDAALNTKLNQKENRGKPQEWKQDLIDKANKAKKEINAMIGTNIVDMNSKQAARLIRFHTQVVGENRVLNYFEKGNPVYADGISWQSTVNIEKAINIYLDPTIENISANMGDDHKIRSFYNNQIAPHDPTLRDVTSDTHAVAATYLLPLSQSSLQVSRNFGTTSNSVAGMSGMYYIVADAYRMAADARGVEPRAMQSITWEGVRSMYPRGFKNSKANIKKVEAIWNRVETKQISKQQALQEINGLMVDFFSKNPDSRPRVTVLPTK